MKFFTVILSLVFYTLVSSGLNVNLHFCQGWVTDISFSYDGEVGSCCCSNKKDKDTTTCSSAEDTAKSCCSSKKEESNNCCNDEEIAIDQFDINYLVPSIQDISLQNKIVSTSIVSSFVALATIDCNTNSIVFDANAPPGTEKIYLVLSRLVLYA